MHVARYLSSFHLLFSSPVISALIFSLHSACIATWIDKGVWRPGVLFFYFFLLWRLACRRFMDLWTSVCDR
jgi:hypothetical protein